jgi:hypothetical protein
LLHGRLGHEAPSAAGKQKRMLGAEIGQPPCLVAENRNVWFFGE